MADRVADYAVYRDFKAKKADLLFIIERSKNRNVVVYEALREGGGALSKQKVRAPPARTDRLACQAARHHPTPALSDRRPDAAC
jgi:hypothetical protein